MANVSSHKIHIYSIMNIFFLLSLFLFSERIYLLAEMDKILLENHKKRHPRYIDVDSLRAKEKSSRRQIKRKIRVEWNGAEERGEKINIYFISYYVPS